MAGQTQPQRPRDHQPMTTAFTELGSSSHVRSPYEATGMLVRETAQASTQAGTSRLPVWYPLSSEDLDAGPSTIIMGHPREHRSTRLSMP